MFAVGWIAVLLGVFEQGVEIVFRHVRRTFRGLNFLKIEKPVPSDARGAGMTMGYAAVRSNSDLPDDVPAMIDLGMKLRHTKLDQAGDGVRRE